MANASEDNVEDVIGKAQRGLRLSESELAARAGLPPGVVRKALGGQVEPEAVSKLAGALGLNARALEGLPRYRPEPVAVEGLAMFSTPWDDMLVNSYLAVDAASGEAVAFDAGADAAPMLDWLRERGLALKLILLTHTHGDHVFALDFLREKTGAPAFVSSREPIDGAEPFEPGREFRCGALRIGTRPTWGHSPGGTTYLVQGLERPVAIVGDALFAGSMGGANQAYPQALANNREHLFTLPGETVLCPGHGPLTTVEAELLHNPFFAKG